MISVCDNKILIEKELSIEDLSFIIGNEFFKKLKKIYVSKDVFLEFKTIDNLLTFMPSLQALDIFLPAGLETHTSTFNSDELSMAFECLEFLKDNGVDVKVTEHFYDEGSEFDFENVQKASNLINYFASLVNIKNNNGEEILSPLEKFLYSYYLVANCKSDIADSSNEAGFLNDFKTDYDEFEYLTNESIASVDLSNVTKIHKNAYPYMLCELANIVGIPCFVQNIEGKRKDYKKFSEGQREFEIPACCLFIKDSKYGIDAIFYSLPSLDVPYFNSMPSFTYSLILNKDLENTLNSELLFNINGYILEGIKGMLSKADYIDDLQKYLDDKDFVREFLKVLYAVGSFAEDGMKESVMQEYIDQFEDENSGLYTNKVSQITKQALASYCLEHRGQDIDCRFQDMLSDERFLKKLAEILLDKNDAKKITVSKVLKESQEVDFDDYVIDGYVSLLNNANYIDIFNLFSRINQKSEHITFKQMKHALNKVAYVDVTEVRKDKSDMFSALEAAFWITNSIRKLNETFDSSESTNNPFEK